MIHVCWQREIYFSYNSLHMSSVLLYLVEFSFSTGVAFGLPQLENKDEKKVFSWLLLAHLSLLWHSSVTSNRIFSVCLGNAPANLAWAWWITNHSGPWASPCVCWILSLCPGLTTDALSEPLFLICLWHHFSGVGWPQAPSAVPANTWTHPHRHLHKMKNIALALMLPRAPATSWNISTNRNENGPCSQHFIHLNSFNSCTNPVRLIIIPMLWVWKWGTENVRKLPVVTQQ